MTEVWRRRRMNEDTRGGRGRGDGGESCRRYGNGKFIAIPAAVLLLCLTTVVNANGKVTTAPRIFEQPTDFETAYKEGEEVRLLCVADIGSQPTYTWKKDGRPLNVNDGHVTMQHPHGTIFIKSPSEADDGLYQCFAGNSFGTAVTIKTQLKKAVISPFKTVSQPPVHRVEIGRPLTLRCNPPDSYPKGNVYWGITRPGSHGLDPVETSGRVMLDYEGHLRIANVVPEDRLKDATVSYVCISNNPLLGAYVQGDEQKIQPLDAPGVVPTPQPPAVMWTSRSRDIAIKGRNKRLKCIFSGLPTPNVTWQRVDGKPMSSRTSETAEGHGTELQITNVDFDDAGVYQCSATNQLNAAPVSVTLTLDVHAMPYWRQNKPPADRQVDEEDDVEFECQADGNPKPNITWYFNGEHHASAPPNPRRTVYETKVRYRNVTRDDNGVVQCIASNDYGHIVANAILTVIAAAPSYTDTPTNKKIVAGQSATFTCRVHGSPKPRLYWTRGDEQITSGRRFTVHSTGDLEVTNAELGDQGTYTCHAVNKLGSDSARATLIVRARTRMINPPRSQVVNATDSVTLYCGATADSAENLTVEWRRDGRQIDFRSSPHVVYNAHDHSLTISSSRVADSGRYACHASTSLDSADSAPATLTVKDRPAPPRSVRVSCRPHMADVTWQPGPDNNDPISEYVVYYRDYPVSSASGGSPTRGPVDRKELQIGASLSSRDEEDEDGEEGTGGAEKDTTVSVSPWRMYEFFVVARNGLGESDLSASSTLTICQTPETAPARNPGRVCSRLQGSRQLVIVWEPLPEQEYNGPGFHYLVSYKLLDSPGLPETIRIDDPTQSEVVVHQREIFRKYEIRVQSANAVGISPVSVRAKIGYSSEGKPMDAPRNFRLDADSLNGTHAKFSWDPIDPAPERVQGFFRGYRIILWRTSKPNDRRTEDIILNDDFESCPDLLRSRRQVQQQSKGGARRSVGRESAAVPRPVVAATDKLWPYSRISAAVAVLNSANEGYQSDPPIEFETPEGVPGQVGSLKVVERGSNHLVVEWKPPVEPNGIINSYVLVCGVAPPNVGRPREIDITNPMQLTETIRDLESSTLYRIWVSGVTAAGQGDRIYIDGKTLEAAAPDKPLIGSLEVEDTSVLVKFSPSEVKPASNPGTIFYVEFVDEKNAERGPWNRTEPLIGAQSVNVSGLQPGTSYAFRVVAVNGIGETVRETRSDPHTVDIDAGGILTFPPPTEIQTDGPDFGAISDNEAIAHASSVWFIVLMILIALLLLILLIVCMIVRSRGEMYPVHEKETMWGRDPLAQDDKPFGEYTAGALPDHARSQGSLDSDEKPLDSGSETDSLGEYEDPEASKFNEDGSFIGLYSGQKSRPGGGGGGGRTVSPSAVNTFV